MFGRRPSAPNPKAPPSREAAKPSAAPAPAPAGGRGAELDQRLSDIKIAIFNDLIDSVDPTELGNLEPAQVREEISDIVAEIISMRNLVISAAEQQVVIADICNDVLGLGPLEPLIARDDIADIMVNGAGKVYIETEGRIELTDIKFRDNAQLMNICQRIVAAVGRRVDESSPICDARLADGSRVNVIVPPLAIDGPTLTIRKFKREKLTLEKLVEFGSLSAPAARVLQIASAVRCNILISGGTGSGKTTLLNCMTRYIDQTERIVTCEDAAELQLQQPHVVRLETRPPNLEGAGAVTMRDLVKNCLRMRPERIIVGEVRGPEAFDLLQAMNTGHDGSMGTIHANTPRDALSRVENMVAMGGYNLPAKAVREQIASAVNVIVQASRLRDGSRKITHVTEVVGMEGEVITLQDLFVFEFEGEDSRGRILGRHRPTGLRPAFWDRARYYGLERDLAEALGEVHVEALDRLPPEVAVLVAVLLIALAVLGWSMVTLIHGPRAKLKRRLAVVAGARRRPRRLAARGPQRKSVQARLKAVEGARQRQFGWHLREQLMQAGWHVEVWQYLAGSGLLALLVLGLGELSGLPLMWGGLAAACLGLGCPKLILGIAAGKRLKAFTAQFADALDVVVRGIRSGLPLGECIAIIGREMPDPVGAEFRQITEGTRIGLTLHEALARAVERMPMAEMRYFAIVLAIQQQTGGNLAETLAKLSEVLRARKRMRDKVQAYAAEARASAAIIGSLPLVVVGMLALVAPQYIGLLFTSDLGNILLAVGILTEAAGILVMRNMINFDI